MKKSIENMKSQLVFASDEYLVNAMCRYDGKSTKLADKYVQDFFLYQPNTKIYIYDHYGTRLADKILLDTICKRLKSEHNIEFKTGQDSNGWFIIRTEPTYNELVADEYHRRK